MPWIPHPTTLTGPRVRLEPLTEAHTPALIAAANDPRIWEQLPIDGTNPLALKTELTNARLRRAEGLHYPFAIILQDTGLAVGSTRFFEMYQEHKKLEIGWTWMSPAVWGTGINEACKLLLLTFAFESLGANRVQLKTRDTNLRSAAAIRRIGASYEGTLRNDRIIAGGAVKDTLLFSIIKEEWAGVKAGLLLGIG